MGAAHWFLFKYLKSLSRWLVAFDKRIMKQGGWSLKRAASLQEAGEAVEPYVGPETAESTGLFVMCSKLCRDLKELDREQNTGKLRLSRFMNYFEIEPKHNEFRNISEVPSFLFVLHLLEELICRICKAKLRKRST